MAKYHQTAPEIGKEVNDFCDRHNLNAAQRVELVQLMFGSTRIASGGRLQFSTRVNSYELIARQVTGVKSKRVTQEKTWGGRPASSYESLRFEIDAEENPGGAFPTKATVGSNEEESE